MLMEDVLRSISRSFLPAFNGLWTHLLALVGQPEPGHGVDEESREVEPHAKLARRVVARERVVVVVEALSHRAEGHEHVLRGVDVLIVRSVAPHVRRTVDKPGDVQHECVAQSGTDEVGDDGRLIPEQPGQERGQDETQKHNGRQVDSVSQTITTHM